jgi:hypothetical protein
LPNGCPASIYLNNRDHAQRPKAKIKYWVKARIVDFIDDETNLIAKCKKCLTITEEPPNFEFLMMQMCEQRVTSWCCFDQGSSRANISFEKSTFEPTDLFETLVVILNFNCNVAMTGLILFLEQEITLKGENNRVFRETVILGEQMFEGAAANQVEGVERQLKVQLSNIKFKTIPSRTKKSEMKPYSERDLKLMSQAQPSTHGTIISNEYFLTVRTQYEGWSCLTVQPMARVPITLVASS